jgi:hypothetical protein
VFAITADRSLTDFSMDGTQQSRSEDRARMEDLTANQPGTRPLKLGIRIQWTQQADCVIIAL